ncbi:MAG: hypothetical protein ACI4E0_10965 [Blautia sp.]
MNKKIKAGILAAGVVVILAGGIGFGLSKMNKTKVDVYQVGEIKQSMWGESNSLEGIITSSVSQKIQLQDNQIVEEVFVQEGQSVVEGTPLLSYDMTLVNIDLEMEKLNREQLKIKKKGLENTLEKLKKKEVAKTGTSLETYEVLPLAVWNSEINLEILPEWKANVPENPQEPEQPEEPQEPENPQEPEQPEEPQEPENPQEPEEPQEPENPEQPEEPQEPENPEQPEEPQEPENPENPEQPENPENPQQPEVKAYERLYGDPELDTVFQEKGEKAVPYKGSGTEEDPYLYLCKENVLIQGAFLNQLAGFTEDGTERHPVHCILELRKENKKEGRLLAALYLNGEKIAEKVKADGWYKTYLGTYDPIQEPQQPQNPEVPGNGENPSDPDPEGIGDLFDDIPGAGDFMEEIPEDAIINTYTKEEQEKAIAETNHEIRTITLDIKESDRKVQAIEKQLNNQVVKSTIVGTVKKVGDKEKGQIDGEPFLEIESTEGIYVTGTVNEYMLEKIKEGQILTGFSYQSGMMFEAQVKEVSPYPASDNYYGYSNNSQVSYYPFTAYISNSQGLENQEWVNMELPAEEISGDGIYLSREYIREKDGEDFVYKEDENHRLVKQPVKTGKLFYGMIEIKEGITEEDYISFPYGKKVKEGAKTKRVSMEDMYSMYD